MAIAIALLLIVVAAILFSFFNPWWFTPLASNWGEIDNMLNITLVITGVVFVAVNLFVVYCLFRFRHKEGGKGASYQPENKKLELLLTVITSIGIMALLAPGLFVYGDFVSVPDDAHEVEVVGHQWQWSYRYPGEDGKLGKTHIRLIDGNNPLGLDPEDANGKDDIVVLGGDLHLPMDKPVKILLRSKDVLHNFYVPQFRVKMDLVPGLVSFFWLTPTREGRYEILCAELCGLGHYSMRSHVVVEPFEAFQQWLNGQGSANLASDMAESGEQPGGQQKKAVSTLLAKGKSLAEAKACTACHSVDGSARVGPSFKDLFGQQETLAGRIDGDGGMRRI